MSKRTWFSIDTCFLYKADWREDERTDFRKSTFFVGDVLSGVYLYDCSVGAGWEKKHTTRDGKGTCIGDAVRVVWCDETIKSCVKWMKNKKKVNLTCENVTDWLFCNFLFGEDIVKIKT